MGEPLVSSLGTIHNWLPFSVMTRLDNVSGMGTRGLQLAVGSDLSCTGDLTRVLFGKTLVLTCNLDPFFPSRVFKSLSGMGLPTCSCRPPPPPLPSSEAAARLPFQELAAVSACAPALRPRAWCWHRGRGQFWEGTLAQGLCALCMCPPGFPSGPSASVHVPPPHWGWGQMTRNLDLKFWASTQRLVNIPGMYHGWSIITFFKKRIAVLCYFYMCF